MMWDKHRCVCCYYHSWVEPQWKQYRSNVYVFKGKNRHHGSVNCISLKWQKIRYKAFSSVRHFVYRLKNEFDTAIAFIDAFHVHLFLKVVSRFILLSNESIWPLLELMKIENLFNCISEQQRKKKLTKKTCRTTSTFRLILWCFIWMQTYLKRQVHKLNDCIEYDFLLYSMVFQCSAKIARDFCIATE